MLKGRGDVIGIETVTQRQAVQTLNKSGEIEGYGRCTNRRP